MRGEKPWNLFLEEQMSTRCQGQGQEVSPKCQGQGQEVPEVVQQADHSLDGRLLTVLLEPPAVPHLVTTVLQYNVLPYPLKYCPSFHNP